MRILVDATPLLVHGGGIKSYFHAWLMALLGMNGGGPDVRLYPFLRGLPALNHLTSPETSTSAWVRILASNVIASRFPPALDLLCRGIDLFHASHHARCTPRRPLLTATVYDMTCWLMPEVHTPANIAATRRYADQVLRHADGIIAISECSRRDCIRFLGVAEDRVEVVHPGIPDAFYDVPQPEGERVRRKLALPGRFVLYVGCVEPRKNLPRLLDAWLLFQRRYGREFELVLAGSDGWESPKTLARIAATEGVRRIGYVPEADLPGLIRAAEALVYPSLYEGFGLPVAQAMAANVPVITSHTSALPEVAGDGAWLVDPRSVSEIAGALELAVQCRSKRLENVRISREKSEEYRLHHTAQNSIRFFERVAGRC